MFVCELVGHDESNPVYSDLSIGNLDRQYDFTRSIVLASIALKRPLLSLEVIRALNYHAISCLHPNAGEWRPCKVTVGEYTPPAFHQVPGLMQMFVDEVNRNWETADPVLLAAFVLWRLNHIHPFINGNGRTARVACYFVLCLKLGGWPDTDVILPELIKANRDDYVQALKEVDASIASGLDLAPLHAFLTKLLNEQMPPEAPEPAAAA
jgi:Fic family protein